jgi:hypothetical protein
MPNFITVNCFRLYCIHNFQQRVILYIYISNIYVTQFVYLYHISNSPVARVVLSLWPSCCVIIKAPWPIIFILVFTQAVLLLIFLRHIIKLKMCNSSSHTVYSGICRLNILSVKMEWKVLHI